MALFELTSQRSGRTFTVDFEREPTELDVDEAIVSLDADADAEELSQQGSAGTLGMATVQSMAQAGARSVEGAALFMEQGGGKLIGPGAQLAGAIGNRLGLFRGIADTAGAIQDEAQRVYPLDPENKVAATIGGGLGQGLNLIAGGAAGRAVGLGSKAMTAIPLWMGATAGTGEGLKVARELGIDSEDKALAMGVLFGGIEAGTEALFGIGSKGAANALAERFKKSAADVLKQAVKSAAGEGVEEVVAGSAQDLLKRAFADEDPENPGFTRTGVDLPKLDAKMLEQRGLEFLGGAAAGTLFGGLQIAQNAGKSERGNLNQPPPLPVDEFSHKGTKARGDGLQDAQTAGTVEGGVAETFEASTGRTTLPDGRRVTFDVSAVTPDALAAMTPETLAQAFAAGMVWEEAGQSDNQTVRESDSGATGRGSQGETNAAGTVGTGLVDSGARVDRGTGRELDQLAGQLAEPPQERTLLGNDPAIGSQAQVQMGQAVPQAPNRPTLPPDATGSEDILNWLTLNPILAPKKGTDTEGGEYDWREAGEFPPKYRRAIMRQGRPNIDERAQAAFEEGLINEPTPDALVAEIRSAIANRETLGQAQRQQEQRLAAAEAARVRFDEEQARLASREAAEPQSNEVDADALAVGDRIAVGESVYEVVDVQMDEDGRTLGYDVRTADGQLIGVDVSQGGVMRGRVQTIRRSDNQTGSDLPFGRARGMKAGQGAAVLEESRDAIEAAKNDRQAAADQRTIDRERRDFSQRFPGQYQKRWTVSRTPDTESARAAERLGRALGVRVVWFHDRGEPGALRGWRSTERRTIFLNQSLAANRAGRETLAPLNLAAHELVHVLRQEHAGVYDDLAAWLKPRLNEGRIREMLLSMGYDPAKGEDLDEEAVAHLAGDLAMRPEFHEQLLTERPGLARRIGEVIRAVLKRIERAFLSGLDAQTAAGGTMTLEEMLNQQGQADLAEVVRRMAEALRVLSGGVSRKDAETQRMDGVAAARGTRGVSAAEDAAYLAAVEAGDLETAQRMVDEAQESAVRREMVNPSSLQPSEEIRTPEVVQQIKQNYQGDESNIDWGEQPAIVATPDGVIRDGHHRHKAWSELGFKNVPVIYIPLEAWEKIEGSGNVDPLVRWASDIVGDYVTGYQSNITSTWGVDFSPDAVTYDDQGNIIPLSQRFPAPRQGPAAAKGTRQSQFGERVREDAAYLAAVEHGDSGNDNLRSLLKSATKDDRPAVYQSWVDRNPKSAAELQRMVDAAAKAAGYSLEGYRASENEDLYPYPGNLVFVAKDKSTAQWFGIPKRVYVKATNNPTKNFALMKPFYELFPKFPKSAREGFETGTLPVWTAQWDLQEWLEKQGITYDSLYFVENGGESSIAVKEINQIKSADPVTYDDAGNIIPPSERFQESTPDIRFARGTRQSQFGERVREDERRSEGFREAEAATFEVRPQQRQHNEAKAIIEEMGLARALDYLANDAATQADGIERSVRIAGLMQIAQNYDVQHLVAARRGDEASMAEADRLLEKAIEAKVELELLGNETGRALAMYNTWARLSPNGMLERFGKTLRKKQREGVEFDLGLEPGELKAVTRDMGEAIGEAQRQATDEILNEVMRGMEGFQPVPIREPMLKGVLAGIGRIAGRIAESATLGRLAQAADDALKAIQGRLYSDPFLLTPLAQAALRAVRDSLRAGMKFAAAVEAGINQAITETGETNVDRKAAAKSIAAVMTQELVRPILSRLALDDTYAVKQAAADLEAAGVTKGRAAQVARDIAGKRKSIRKRSAEAATKRMLQRLAPKKRAQRRKQRMPKVIATLMDAQAQGLLDQEISEAQVMEAYGKAFNLPGLTPEQTRKLQGMAAELNRLPEGVLRSDKAREFLNELALIEGIPASEALMSMWYANILSGLGTQGVNVWGNGIMALVKGFAVMASSPREAGRYVRGLLGPGLKQGREEAAAALRKGVGHKHTLKWDDAQRLGALELLSAQGSPKTAAQWLAYVGSLGTLTRYVFRALGAMDVLFYYSANEGMTHLATARALRKQNLKPGTRAFEAEFVKQLGGDGQQWVADLEQARDELRAAGQNLDPGLIQRRAYELRLERRTKDVRETAERWADRLTFQQEPEGVGQWLSKVITEVQRFRPMGVPVGRLLVPFNRIVSNLFENALDFTPIGVARAIKGGHLTGKGGVMDTVERRERALSSAFGFALAGLLYALTKHWDDDDEVDAPFRLYGQGPAFGSSQRANMPEGWRPFTIKWGDRYVSYAETPMGPFLAAVGSWLDMERYSASYQKKTLNERAYVAFQAAMKGFTSQGVLSSVADGLEVLSGETMKSPQSILGNPARGAVPASGLIKDIGEIFDPGKISDDDIWGALVKDVPVVKNYGTLPDRNWRGEPISQAGAPVVRRFVTGQKLDPESAWLGRNKLRIPQMPAQILVGQYTGIPQTRQGNTLVETYARRGLQLTALENGAFTREQWDRFTQRAGTLTAQGVMRLRKQWQAKYPQGRVPETLQERLQTQVETITQAARKTAMLEEMGRVR